MTTSSTSDPGVACGAGVSLCAHRTRSEQRLTLRPAIAEAPDLAYTQSTMSHTEAATGIALDTLIRSPFARLNALLADTPPGADPILFSLGEPHTSLPPFVQPVLEEHLAAFGKYPPIRGVLPLRQAICPLGSQQ